MFKKNININPQLIADSSNNKFFNLHTLIYDHLSAMQSGWLMNEQSPADASNAADIILYHKSSKKPNLWYGFQIEQKRTPSNPDYVYIYLRAICGSIESDGILSEQHSVPSIPLYDYNHSLNLNTQDLASLLTIGIGKHNTSCFISVVPKNAGYILMNAVSGEDSSGNVYAFFPSTVSDGSERYIMDFISQTDQSWFRNSVACDMYNTAMSNYSIGSVMSSGILILCPFVNPANGNVCPDLFMPLFGPSAVGTRLYDVSINGRTFVTGSSRSPSSISYPITDEDYNVVYKVFMEV